MTSQTHKSSTTLLKIHKTIPSEHPLRCSGPLTSGRQDVLQVEAGAAGVVVERTSGAADFGIGDEVVACLTQEQLEEVNKGADVRVASYAMCRWPSNISTSQAAELVVHFMAAAALLDQANILSVQHLGNRPEQSALNPNNVALMVRESKANIILVQLLCHLFPEVDVFFCYHQAAEPSSAGYPQGLYFMLPLESGARASARYPPNSQEDLAGYFRANAEAYTKSSNIGLAIDTAGMLGIKPEVWDLLKDKSECHD